MKKKFLLWAGIVMGAIVILSVGFVFSVNYLYGKYVGYDNAFKSGKNYFEHGQYGEAIESFKQALPDRDWKEVELQILRSYRRVDHTQEEFDFLKRRLREKPDQLFDLIRLNRMGEISHKSLRDLNSAKRYYQLSVDRYKDPASFFGLSEIYEQEGDLHRAISFREEGLKQMTLIDNPELAKNKAKRLSELADLYLKVNRIEDAKNVFQEALKLDPNNRAVQEALQKSSSKEKTGGVPAGATL